MPRVFEIAFIVPVREKARLTRELFEAGAGAVEERDVSDAACLVVYANGRRDAARLSRVGSPLATSVARRELDPSWQSAWTEHLSPEPITDRVVLCPKGDATPVGRGKLRLWFEPEMVFGVGSHPTTRLAARAVERHCVARRGSSVLDVGTGTGVLAMLAAALGAKRVLGLDVDPAAVRSARRNARLNQLVPPCSFSTRTPAQLRERFDLVVANIEVWVLLELAPALAARLRPDGTLILCGLLRERTPEVAARFGRLGLEIDARHREKGWESLELSPKPDHPLIWATRGRLARKARRQ